MAESGYIINFTSEKHHGAPAHLLLQPARRQPVPQLRPGLGQLDPEARANTLQWNEVMKGDEIAALFKFLEPELAWQISRIWQVAYFLPNYRQKIELLRGLTTSTRTTTSGTGRRAAWWCTGRWSTASTPAPGTRGRTTPAATTATQTPRYSSSLTGSH